MRQVPARGKGSFYLSLSGVKDALLTLKLIGYVSDQVVQLVRTVEMRDQALAVVRDIRVLFTSK